MPPLAEQPQKLLFDENLAARAAVALADLYPGSKHVGDVGLLAATDIRIWQFAAENRFAVVTKDADFQRLSVFHGPPPKIVWIRRGNCSTDDLIRLLRESRTVIDAFLAHDEAAFLALA